ncbi:polysaccharide biosynthesis protein [Ramlibacter sp.]|uniref:polysaccharide biosynthesis protein n=1 Tax=Ramlibacter sp. TaxID=1917967 RepID=UPI002D5FDBF2|nr:polysaccharide biosynthesis protein [Ramlibacter sp.]HYD74993.1 polysaccharide biosynthesis protein [Ramlibacter sp.]
MLTENWKGKSVLITGVCGTVGSELLRQVSALGCARIIGMDNNESELFFLGQAYAGRDDVRLFIGDLRDREEMLRRMRGIDIVLHAAALKHVILCEEAPRDAVQTNIIGMMNIIDAAETNGVQRVIFTSSDKAVNPTNVMGTTKLMGERLVTAANAHRHSEDGTIFASTRFGNVLGSRGSVVPLFRRQIAAGGPVTLTDPAMTRFIMTLEEAVRLVMSSVFLARGGEVFVTKMPVARISDLAAVMIDELAPLHGYKPADIPIRHIGTKAGEKLYEELLSEEEIRRTVELENFFAVLPAFKSVYRSIDYGYEGLVADRVSQPYNSRLQAAMSPTELAAYLRANDILKAED